MRILFVSNYYPPESFGGYELWCQEVAQRMVERGHQVWVLTSRSRALAETCPDGPVSVLRRLNLEVIGGLKSTLWRVVARRRLEAENQGVLEELAEQFSPDVVLAWGLWNVPRAVPLWLEAQYPGRMAYYISDYWPTLPSAELQQLEAPSRRALLGLPKRLAAAAAKVWIGEARPRMLRFENPICVTQSVRDSLVAAGIPVAHGPVIYGGTDPGEFQAAGAREFPESGPLKALFLGRLHPDKGVHTVVDALAILNGKSPEVTLDIYGRGEAGYCSALERKIKMHSIGGRVRMHEPVARAEIPELLSRYDVLVFASEWDEPFGRVLTEGMAAGLCVVGTRTGGAAEILKEEVNGLSFPPGDAEALARQLERLATEPELRRRLVKTASAEVRERFSLARMVAEVEAFLRRLGPRKAAEGAA